jgi:hypothetical protein
VSDWQLDDLKDSLDVREIYDDTASPPKVKGAQIRNHWVIVRHRKIHASTTFHSQKGSMSASVDYNVGAYHKIKIIVGGHDRYLCVENGFSPEQPGTPGEYAIERQTWEYYSKWEDAPDAWNLVEA